MTSMWDRMEQQRRDEFEAALTLMFTPWQRSILDKRSRGETLTPAEREELSRRIKPKIRAMEVLQDLKWWLPFYS